MKKSRNLKEALMANSFNRSLSPVYIPESLMGQARDHWAFGHEPWTPPAFEDLLPDLSLEEQLKLQNQLRKHERTLKSYTRGSPCPTQHSEGERDSFLIHHARFALHHYNAKNPGEEFDVVKPLMAASAGLRHKVYFHVNFWALSRKSKKIKRFFAEVRYKSVASSSVCSDLSFPVPGAEKLPSSSSVSSDLPFPVPGAEKPPSSSSACSDLPSPVPGAEKPPFRSADYYRRLPIPPLVPIVEVCTIIEEPLGRHRKSCAFCPGYFDILHPKGRKFVCGNDKDRMVQQLVTGSCRFLEMPFTCSRR